MVASRYVSARRKCPVSIRRMVSAENVEKVVKAPQIPTDSIIYAVESPKRVYRSPKPTKIPNNRQPKQFTINVAMGIVVFHCAQNTPTK